MFGETGLRIGRVKVIFKLPEQVSAGNGLVIDAPVYWPKSHLAYVEWYKNLASSPDPIHGMFTIGKVPSSSSTSGSHSIIPLGSIRQSCMLIPQFPKSQNSKSSSASTVTWTSEKALDVNTKFWLNNWQSMYSFQTLY